jgi:hypothetical protein
VAAHLLRECGLADLAWAGEHLHEAARLAKPPGERSRLGTGIGHGPLYILLNTLSIFTQYPEQRQTADARDFTAAQLPLAQDIAQGFGHHRTLVPE